MIPRHEGLPLDALMTLLAVVRRGSFSAAAAIDGVNHSTVSRRIATLESALGGRVLTRVPGGSRGHPGWEPTSLGRRALAAAERIEDSLRELDQPDAATLRGVVRIAAPEVFSARLLAPAMSALRDRHPALAVELLAVTQRARQHRSDVDLEIVAGRPRVVRAQASEVFSYALRLYASPAYLTGHGGLDTLSGLSRHPLVYYVESALQVDELDQALHELPPSPPSLRSTSVFAHIEATAAGAGIGILPDFVADADPRLVRVLEGQWSHTLSYWAVMRDDIGRAPAVDEVLAAVRAHLDLRYPRNGPAQ